MFTVHLAEEAPVLAVDAELEDREELQGFLDRWEELEREKPSGLIPVIVWHPAMAALMSTILALVEMVESLVCGGA